jgi:hypothetical protein
MEDGGRLAPMAVELADRLAILVVVRRFPCMGVADSHSLRYDNFRLQRLRPFATFRSLIYLYSFSAFLGGCAT